MMFQLQGRTSEPPEAGERPAEDGERGGRRRWDISHSRSQANK